MVSDIPEEETIVGPKTGRRRGQLPHTARLCAAAGRAYANESYANEVLTVASGSEKGAIQSNGPSVGYQGRHH